MVTPHLKGMVFTEALRFGTQAEVSIQAEPGRGTSRWRALKGNSAEPEGSEGSELERRRLAGGEKTE